MAPSLTYQLLDELEVACTDASNHIFPAGFEVRSLGPVIQLQRSSQRELIAEKISYASNDLERAGEFILAPRGIFLNKAGTVGMAASSGGGDAVLELMQRALPALKRTPFPTAAATQAIAALGELDSNIEEHSGDSKLGVIAFEIAERFIGIYASDRGCGVLDSLRRHPAFSGLDDSGEALRLAIQEGVSSSTQLGRGMGFRPIFRGLASLSALLRFRSGDSLLEINGFGGGIPVQGLRERASISGFHVFVHCTFSR